MEQSAPLSTELMNKIRRIEIRTRHKVDDLFAGSYLSVFKGRGIEFDEVRPYQAGDDVRAVDWNVTARLGELYVKRFIEERELTLHQLGTDPARGLEPGESTRRLREHGPNLIVAPAPAPEPEKKLTEEELARANETLSSLLGKKP